jgi:hypothetical protein
LLLVFSLKSALLPLHFWLPKTYGAASASVVALFAVMTKVGFYSICRVFAGIFGNEAGALANLATPWIWPLAIATIAIGSAGVYAATSLRSITANMVIVSVGTLLLAFVMDGGRSLFVGFYYMLHSTLVTGALFLIADLIGRQRGIAMDEMVRARPVNQATLLSVFFFAFAIAAIGLPPLSGFVGKALALAVSEPACRAGVGVAGPLDQQPDGAGRLYQGGQYVLLARFPKRRVRRPERAIDANGFPIHFAVGNRIDDRFCRFDFGIQPGGRQRYSQAPDNHATADQIRQEPNP